MKQTTLGKLKDGARFKLNRYSKVIYKTVRKDKNGVTFTSLNSEWSYLRSKTQRCFV